VNDLSPWRTGTGRVVAGVIVVLVLGVVVGLSALWPRGELPRVPALAGAGSIDRAQVTAISLEGCANFAGPGCRLVTVRLTSGSREGQSSSITLPSPKDEAAPTVVPGDEIRVARNVPGGIDPKLADQLPIDDPSQQPYAFVDFERQSVLLWLAIAFAVVVVGLGRLQGLRSLIGLAVSLFLVVRFVVPAILNGSPALLVALVGSLAVMLVTMVLSHGTGLKSAAAILATTVALLLTALLALLAVGAAHITGLSSEESEILTLGHTGISISGLVLAGMVIGALGVLDDVTVSQASTVMALRRANPALGLRKLFHEGLSVGRDHLAATVNTLVLAYAGGALPILLIFTDQRVGFGEAINREPVAEQIVAGLVGSTGLIAAVPLTTALAALLAVRLPSSALPGEDHGHAH
jgi:uncharacterized membrane protein